jgi:hypothetical protein
MRSSGIIFMMMQHVQAQDAPVPRILRKMEQ